MACLRHFVGASHYRPLRSWVQMLATGVGRGGWVPGAAVHPGGRDFLVCPVGMTLPQLPSHCDSSDPTVSCHVFPPPASLCRVWPPPPQGLCLLHWGAGRPGLQATQRWEGSEGPSSPRTLFHRGRNLALSCTGSGFLREARPAPRVNELLGATHSKGFHSLRNSTRGTVSSQTSPGE